MSDHRRKRDQGKCPAFSWNMGFSMYLFLKIPVLKDSGQISIQTRRQNVFPGRNRVGTDRGYRSGPQPGSTSCHQIPYRAYCGLHIPGYPGEYRYGTDPSGLWRQYHGSDPDHKFPALSLPLSATVSWTGRKKWRLVQVLLKIGDQRWNAAVPDPDPVFPGYRTPEIH